MVRGIPEQLKNEFVRFWNRNKGLMVSKLDWLDKQAWRHTKNDEEIVRLAIAACRTSVRGKLAAGSGATTDWETELQEGVSLNERSHDSGDSALATTESDSQSANESTAH
jgi:hypothetical protein